MSWRATFLALTAVVLVSGGHRAVGQEAAPAPAADDSDLLSRIEEA